MLTLPSALDRVIRKVEAGELQVHIAENGRNGFVRGVGLRQRGGSRGSASAMLATVTVSVAAITAGVVLTLNQVTTAGWFCFGLAALAVAGLVFRR